MERLRMVLTPALRSSCSARLIPKRRMCSGGGRAISQGKEAGGVVSQGKEAGCVLSQGKEATGDYRIFSLNNIWKTSLCFLGGGALGLCLSNPNAAAKEKNRRRDREEATERHNREMERQKRENELCNRAHQAEMAASKALWELTRSQMKVVTLEVKVMTLELKVKELAAATGRVNAAADKNE